MDERPEPVGPLIASLITCAVLVWGLVWAASWGANWAVSFLGQWVKIPLAVAVSIYWFMGLPAPFVPWHGHVVPPLGNFIFTLLGLGAWAVSLWIIFM